MTSLREYIFVKTGFKRCSSKVLAPDSLVALYKFKAPKAAFFQYNMTLHVGHSSAGPVVGGCRISTFSSDINLAFGDPNGSNAVWEDMHRTSYWKVVDYSLSVEVPSGGRRDFTWKGTHDVEGFAKKMDIQHLKLVEN